MGYVDMNVFGGEMEEMALQNGPKCQRDQCSFLYCIIRFIHINCFLLTVRIVLYVRTIIIIIRDGKSYLMMAY